MPGDGTEEPEDLSMVALVPQEYDYNTGEPVYLPIEHVDFVSDPPVLRNFDQYGKLFPSREEAKRYLWKARLELVDKLPLRHPLWDRIKKDGFLIAEELFSTPDESMGEEI
jgi:hypothetical protein